MKDIQTLKKLQLLDLLGGVAPSAIPIGAVKRRSLAIQLRGRLFRIGRIDMRKAFVVQVGGVRLVYVSPQYTNYRYVAQRLFSLPKGLSIDIDHSLGRVIANKLNFHYVLLLALPREVNRSHGHLERDAVKSKTGIDLRKHCFLDERILLKWTSSTVTSLKGLALYRNADQIDRDFTEAEMRSIVRATGYGRFDIAPGYLTEVYY